MRTACSRAPGAHCRPPWLQAQAGRALRLQGAARGARRHPRHVAAGRLHGRRVAAAQRRVRRPGPHAVARGAGGAGGGGRGRRGGIWIGGASGATRRGGACVWRCYAAQQRQRQEGVHEHSLDGRRRVLFVGAASPARAAGVPGRRRLRFGTVKQKAETLRAFGTAGGRADSPCRGRLNVARITIQQMQNQQRRVARGAEQRRAVARACMAVRAARTQQGSMQCMRTGTQGGCDAWRQERNSDL